MFVGNNYARHGKARRVVIGLTSLTVVAFGLPNRDENCWCNGVFVWWLVRQLREWLPTVDSILMTTSVSKREHRLIMSNDFLTMYNGQDNLSAIWYNNRPHEYNSFFSRLFQLIPLLLFCKSYFSMGIQNNANEQNCYYKQSRERTGNWKENFNIYFYSNTVHLH